jgi:hypothetical protein
MSARAGTERRAGGEGAGTHAEARAEGRGHVAEEVAAAGAVAVVESGDGDIGAHPLAAGFAERIDALHGKTGHVLHLISLRGRKSLHFSGDHATSERLAAAPGINPSSPCRLNPSHDPMNGNPWSQRPRVQRSTGPRGNSASDGADCGARGLWCQEKRVQGIVVWLREHF